MRYKYCKSNGKVGRESVWNGAKEWGRKRHGTVSVEQRWAETTNFS